MERVNLLHQQSGLPPVVLDEALSEGCRQHAAYLDQNLDQVRAGLDAHNEYPDRQGYSEAGKDAGMNGNIHYGVTGAQAVDRWFQAYYHRSPIVSPSVTRIGYGDHQSAALGSTITVLRFERFGPQMGSPVVAYFGGADVAWQKSKIIVDRVELDHHVIAPNKPSNPRFEITRSA